MELNRQRTTSNFRRRPKSTMSPRTNSTPLTFRLACSSMASLTSMPTQSNFSFSRWMCFPVPHPTSRREFPADVLYRLIRPTIVRDSLS